jgi:hypothetical protein
MADIHHPLGITVVYPKAKSRQSIKHDFMILSQVQTTLGHLQAPGDLKLMG